MPRLLAIELENFRVFKNHEIFDLAPITIVTGPNSSGKSSLFKALLLMKNNNVSSFLKLNFSGRYHQLGTFKNAKSDSSDDNDLMSFAFVSEFPFLSKDANFLRRHKTPVAIHKGVNFELVEDGLANKNEYHLELFYKDDKSNDNGKLVKFTLGRIKRYANLDEYEVEIFLEFDIAQSLDQSHDIFIDISIIRNDEFLKKHFLRNKNLREVNIIKNSIVPVEEILEHRNVLYENPQKVLSELSNDIAKSYNLQIYRPILEFLNLFSDLTSHIEYIEAVRANTRRIYSNDSQGTSFNELLVDYSLREPSPIGLKFLNKWLKEFGIANRIEIKKIEGVANTVYLIGKHGKKALADLGYGITQFLPILLKISMEKPIQQTYKGFPVKKLILIEEPETNLHPKLQSKISDMLIDAMNKFAVSFLVETHSEYLIRKLQYLISKKFIDHNNILIYYIRSRFNVPEDKKQIEKIKIKNSGRLSQPFGTGFIDEATRLSMELFRSSNK